MRVIAKSNLVKFWSLPGRADSKGALQSWHDEALKANWVSPQSIKDQYSHASIWVKFVGTHAQYDQINVETVNDY